MAEPGQDAVSGGVRSLSKAVREMRNAAADREDVVVELRELSRVRLEILVQKLEPVFADVPKDDPTFDLAISSGDRPRLWIDAVAHVVMARDRRTYRFVRDTRLGRVVLAESAEIGTVADQVMRYIAERLVERERFVHGEVEAPKAANGRLTPANGWSALLAALLLGVLGGVVGALTVMLAMSVISNLP